VVGSRQIARVETVDTANTRVGEPSSCRVRNCTADDDYALKLRCLPDGNND